MEIPDREDSAGGTGVKEGEGLPGGGGYPEKMVSMVSTASMAKMERTVSMAKMVSMAKTGTLGEMGIQAAADTLGHPEQPPRPPTPLLDAPYNMDIRVIVTQPVTLVTGTP